MSRHAKQPMPIQRLIAAMARAAVALGEAQWTNGYRTTRASVSDAESVRLYEKEMAQWRHVAVVEDAFGRLARRLLRAAAKSAAPRKPKAKPKSNAKVKRGRASALAGAR